MKIILYLEFFYHGISLSFELSFMCTVVTHVFEMSKMRYMRIVILENQQLISKLQVGISSQTGDTQIYSIVKSYQIIKWINLKKILPISSIYLLQGIVNL